VSHVVFVYVWSVYKQLCHMLYLYLSGMFVNNCVACCICTCVKCLYTIVSHVVFVHVLSVYKTIVSHVVFVHV